MCTVPYTVSKISNKNAYKLDLLKTMRNHNMSHVSQLDHYTPQVVGQTSSEPHPVIVNDLEEWEVKQILDSNLYYPMLHNLIEWGGYNHIHTTWEPLENLENARKLINEWH